MGVRVCLCVRVRVRACVCSCVCCHVRVNVYEWMDQLCGVRALPGDDRGLRNVLPVLPGQGEPDAKEPPRNAGMWLSQCVCVLVSVCARVCLSPARVCVHVHVYVRVRVCVRVRLFLCCLLYTSDAADD